MHETELFFYKEAYLKMGRYNLILILCMKHIFLRMGLLKHMYDLILILFMKRILFFKNGLIETLVQPHSRFVHFVGMYFLIAMNNLIQDVGMKRTLFPQLVH